MTDKSETDKDSGIADDGDPHLDFAAERAAILASGHLQMVSDAGEVELRAAASEITLKMFQKAYALGYVKGVKDAQEYARQQAEGIRTVEIVMDDGGVKGD